MLPCLANHSLLATCTVGDNNLHPYLATQQAFVTSTAPEPPPHHHAAQHTKQQTHHTPENRSVRGHAVAHLPVICLLLGTCAAGQHLMQASSALL